MIDFTIGIKQKNPNWLKKLRGVISGIERDSELECAIGFPSEKMSEYASGVSVGEVAIWNEYGVPSHNIPSRPFLQTSEPMIGDMFNDTMAAAIPSIMDGRVSVAEILSECGEGGVEIVKEVIVSGQFAANSPATVAKKGSDVPLVDTGELYESVSYTLRGRE
jgi:hypothetical protein